MEIPKQKKKKQNYCRGARKLRKDQEMAWAPPRNMSIWPDWEEARSMKESEWRLEPEEEAEVPEIISVSDAVESTNVDLMAKAAANRPKKDLPEEKDKHLAKGREEIKGKKRKVTRVESEGTQDYVREAKSADQKEVEERIFVPSATSFPQKPLFRCTISAAKRPSATGSWLLW